MNWKWAVLTACVIVLGSVMIAYAWEDSEIADAIWYTEGGVQARQDYGIEGFVCQGIECRKISLNTIRNQRRRHNDHECDYTYLECLSRRYCPPNHKVWLRNVMWFLNNPKGVSHD